MAAVSDVPLVASKTLFGNASHLEPKLSPDGRWLSPVEGVMNVGIAPVDAPDAARP